MTLRNIGISAHIDSGKTTLAERILFLTGRLRRIHEVRGRDGVGAKMDHDPIEGRRGISIQSAATTVTWDGVQLNVIDTPGHVDFTVEVERALAVLDGAILLLSATSGVQAQTLTVDRQMTHHRVPRIAFINKCDLAGADPVRVVAQIRERLGHNAALIQFPIGLGSEHRGVVDLWSRRAFAFLDEGGTTVAEVEHAWTSEHEQARERMIDAVSLEDDVLTGVLLEGAEITDAVWHQAVRRGVLAGTFLPALLGSAMKNIGVQPVLDAVVRYLPAPSERVVSVNSAPGPQILSGAVEDDPVAYTFKVQETEHGSLSWVRVYQGFLERGLSLVADRTGRPIRMGRLVRLHADELETVERVDAGDIVAVFGSALAFGDTLSVDGDLSFEGMVIPEPVVEVAVKLIEGSQERLGKTLARFARQDPTVRVRTDPESNELRLRGMGELQLEILAERLSTEANVVVELGAPSVAYRTTITQPAGFDTVLKKQTGGPGQFAHIIGRIEPAESVELVWEVVGGSVPAEYQKAVTKGFKAALEAGHEDCEIVGVRMVVTGGGTHPNDSSDRAFARVARMALLEALEAAEPVVLEPIMAVSIEADEQHQGAVIRSLLTRRGTVSDTRSDGRTVIVEASVPLAELFGYTAALRSATAGTGTASVAFHAYKRR